MFLIQSIAFTMMLVISHTARLASSTRRFNGMAKVVFEPSNLTLLITDDVMDDVETSLKDVLSGSVVDIKIARDTNESVSTLTEFNRTVLFQGSTDNLQSIPACMLRQKFGLNGNVSAKYEIISLSLQTFTSTDEIAQQCQSDDQNIIYIEHHEDGCQFNQLDCEPNDGPLTYRFNLYERDSVLYSFYCLKSRQTQEPLTLDTLLTQYTPQEVFAFPCDEDWAYFTWSSSCELNAADISSTKYPPFENISLPVMAGQERLSQEIGTLPDSLQPVCYTVSPASGPPILTFYGDITWDLLPEWLKVGIRVLNAVSLTATAFCLVTYMMFPELRNAHGRNVMSLLVAVLMSQVYTSGYIPLQTENRPLCVFIATLLYYVVILPNYWWASMAIFLAWTLGRKGIHRMDEESSSRLFLLLSLLGWGLPLVFTLLILCLHTTGINVFNIDDYCWINTGWPTVLLFIQTLVPFVLNCVLFGLVVHRLRTNRKELATLQSKPSQRDGRQLTIKLTAIFGVCWLPAWVFYIFFLIYWVRGLAIVSQLLNQFSAFILPAVLACNRRVWRLWKARLSPLGARINSFTAWTRSSSQPRGETGEVKQSNDNAQENHVLDAIDSNDIQLNYIHNSEVNNQNLYE